MRRRSPRRLTRKGADRPYIAWLHTQPCVLTGLLSNWSGGIQASHIRRQTGLGLKPPDRQALPMLRSVHEDWEQRKGFFRGWDDQRRWAWAEPLIAEHVARYEAQQARRAA
jgi:hypothetical protein